MCHHSEFTGAIQGEQRKSSQLLDLFAEASRLKQAAERKTAGREAAALFEQSAEKYRAALQMELTVSQRLDALNDLVSGSEDSEKRSGQSLWTTYQRPTRS